MSNEATTLLPVGYSFSMEKDIIYAVPARSLEVLVDDVIEVSVGTAFTTFFTVSSNSPTTIVGGSFTRCTNSTCTVILTRIG